jgi:hypothetical protein
LDEISYNKRILSDRFCLLKITSGGVEDIGYSANYITSLENDTSFLEGKGRYPSASNLHSDDEAKFPNFSRGRFKYARKVDYLIDEIIRKSRRTFCQSDEREITVPSSIGPQPTTDHALSIYHESSVVAEALKNDREKIIRPKATLSQPMEGNGQSSFTRKHNSYAGDSSHEDWGIEEIIADRLKEVGNAEEKMTSFSDEFCVDSEDDLSVEDVEMVDSGHSDMEVATQ